MTFGTRLREYLASKQIAASMSQYDANEFYSLIMAAARFADTDNFEKLEEAFPEIMQELRARYNAPGGALDQKEREIVEQTWNQQ